MMKISEVSIIDLQQMLRVSEQAEHPDPYVVEALRRELQHRTENLSGEEGPPCE